MTSPPDPDAVRKAMDLAERQGRTPEETAFLKQFFADHLQPHAGEDPSAHAARLPTPQLFRLYRKLRNVTDVAPPGTHVLAPAVIPPAPVAAEVRSEEHTSELQ